MSVRSAASSRKGRAYQAERSVWCAGKKASSGSGSRARSLPPLLPQHGYEDGREAQAEGAALRRLTGA